MKPKTIEVIEVCLWDLATIRAVATGKTMRDAPSSAPTIVVHNQFRENFSFFECFAQHRYGAFVRFKLT